MNDFPKEKFIFEHIGYDNESWAAMIQGEDVHWMDVHRKFMEFMAAVYVDDIECRVRELYIRDYLDRKGEK